MVFPWASIDKYKQIQYNVALCTMTLHTSCILSTVSYSLKPLSLLSDGFFVVIFLGQGDGSFCLVLCPVFWYPKEQRTAGLVCIHGMWIWTRPSKNFNHHRLQLTFLWFVKHTYGCIYPIITNYYYLLLLHHPELLLLHLYLNIDVMDKLSE